MKLSVTEIRDWIAFASGPIGILVARHWRQQDKDQQPGGRHHVLELSDTVTATDAVVLKLSPAHGTSSSSMALTTGNDAGTQAVLDQMAEAFPYEFPAN